MNQLIVFTASRKTHGNMQSSPQNNGVTAESDGCYYLNKTLQFTRQYRYSTTARQYFTEKRKALKYVLQQR